MLRNFSWSCDSCQFLHLSLDLYMSVLRAGNNANRFWKNYDFVFKIKYQTYYHLAKFLPCPLPICTFHDILWSLLTSSYYLRHHFVITIGFVTNMEVTNFMTFINGHKNHWISTFMMNLNHMRNKYNHYI